ncbi:conserved hypothetical protein [Parvibaculum lavamentivorans DS-1]|uniref:Glycosyl hydrolase family 32 N-terminal domain-containing protein n=1 Tax=Parvibaculum lavamentivorans (strain DS-1 / DSM 13023 / NCIMB 13966) TaxID=402881 RepID=A7HYD8_PARL1|nr:hypothetical protein [Parvibaculum lavamentivorans]ABS64921.1 conserved hypothetical protein [Parvibaculum lavamentivorans DS-1]
MDKKKQVWRRLGRVIAPEASAPWWQSHASYPTALVRSDGLIDVYFSVRDATSRSSLASVTLSLDGEGFQRESAPKGPLLGPGMRGAFDADGVSVGCVIEKDNELIAYYLGWSVGVSVPFSNFIGIATAPRTGDAVFRRREIVPVIGRSAVDPFTLGYPWVMRSGSEYRMWYGSHLAWGEVGLEMKHVIKEAKSSDGFSWSAIGKVAIPLKGAEDPQEFAVSRPSVVAEADGIWSMWYARRRPGYELGFAISDDEGATWQRQDERIAWTGSPDDWDDREQTYPCVFDHHGRRYMLYNGNGYGRTGFGLAVLETS